MSLAPYIPTEYPVIDVVLEMLDLRPGKKLYDMGCGDGRVLKDALYKYSVRGVGIEENPIMFELVKSSIEHFGLGDWIKIIEGDACDDSINISEADAVYMYLSPEGVNKLKPKLEVQLQPSCRIVSKDYPISGWKPIEVKELPGSVKLYLYRMDSI